MLLLQWRHVASSVLRRRPLLLLFFFSSSIDYKRDINGEKRSMRSMLTGIDPFSSFRLELAGPTGTSWN